MSEICKGPYQMSVSDDVAEICGSDFARIIGIEVDRVMREGICGKVYDSVLITKSPPSELGSR